LIAMDCLPKIRRYRPRVLAFTSKRAAEEFIGYPVGYGLLPEKVGETRLFVLPSPSGAARRYWHKKPWRDLARLRDITKTAITHRPRASRLRSPVRGDKWQH